MSAPAASSFSFEPLFLVLAVAAVFGYVRLAKTVERPSPGRATLFALGILLIAVSLNSPLETIAVHYLLVVHLLGLVFWWPVFSDRPHRISTAVRLVYLGAAYAGSAFLSLALIFSARAFYGFYEAAPRLWGFSPQKDQNLGGILMNGEQMAVFFVAMSYFLLRLLSEEEESQRALEG